MKTVIFDLGNVLINVDFLKMYQRFSLYISYSFEQMMNLLKEVMVDYNKGMLSPPQFYAEVKRILNLDIGYEDFCEVWVGIFEKNRPIYDFAAGMDRDKVRIIIASNTDPLHYQYIKGKYSLDFAGGEFLSYLEKEVKPELSFFRRLMEVYAIDPASAIFIDDLQDNVAAARLCGLYAVHHVDGAATIRELELFLRS